MKPDHSDSLDYSYIVDGIYIGTNQCCQSHFEESLLKQGIEADISLEEDKIDQPFGVSFYLWLPVKDKTPPSQEQLDFGARAIENLVKLGKKTYIHCRLGHGRAPTLVAAYLIIQGKSVDEAIEFIKSKRPSTHLEEVQIKALRNITFR